MLVSPYLLVNLAKNMPVLSRQLSRFGKWADSWAHFRPSKPRPGGFRDYMGKRRQTLSDAASRGEMQGWGSRLLHPALAMRNATVRRLGNTNPLIAGSTRASRGRQNQARSGYAEALSAAEADQILSHYGANGSGGGGSSDRGRPNGRDSSTINKMNLEGVSSQEMVMAAILAKLQRAEEAGSADNSEKNIKLFFQALNKARSLGASQEDLQAVNDQALAVFKNSGNFAASANIKAHQLYFSANMPASRQIWAEYDADMWDTRLDSDGKDTAFTALRRKVMSSEMRNQVMEQPLYRSGQKHTLNGAYIPDGSLAQEVFLDLFDTHGDFESAIRAQAASFSSADYAMLDRAMHGGLAYNALTANLDGADFAALNDFVNGQLSATDESNLRDKIARIQGHHVQAGIATNPSEIDLAAIQKMTERLTPFSVEQYGDLVGWSFKNVVINLPPNGSNPTI